jgi:type IV secretory pathway VirB10-like protein
MAAVRQQIEASKAAHTDPTTAYKERLNEIKALGVAGESKGESTPNNDYDQFAGNPDAVDRWKLNSTLEAPRSQYELRAGFVLLATLISGINSELPGQIMAQVNQDVFDTATGRWLLVPQGSRLVGSYSSQVAYGQARVLVAWQRIVFPDGKAIDIGAMPGADSAGYAGFTDQVNNHFFRLYGSAILMSAVTAGFALSQPQSVATSGTTYSQNASSALSQALGQQLGQVTSQMIAKNMNTSPTLEIRPGYRFNVIVTKDLTFSKPYKAFDY